jgi:hypothetical protein
MLRCKGADKYGGADKVQMCRDVDMDVLRWRDVAEVQEVKRCRGCTKVQRRCSGSAEEVQSREQVQRC